VIFALCCVVRNFGLGGVSGKFGKEVLKALLVAVKFSCLGLLDGVVEGFCQALNR